jgi:hypothetical protein
MIVIPEAAKRLSGIHEHPRMRSSAAAIPSPWSVALMGPGLPADAANRDDTKDRRTSALMPVAVTVVMVLVAVVVVGHLRQGAGRLA